MPAAALDELGATEGDFLSYEPAPGGITLFLVRPVRNNLAETAPLPYAASAENEARL